MLARAGFHVPQPEIDPDETNPRGFGEPRWVVDFHKRLMRERGVTVFDSRPAAWQATAGTAEDADAIAELIAWLRVNFVGVENLAVKDPRTGWFLPLWRKAAGNLDAEVSFVSMLRHPAEVVESARVSYGEWQNDLSRAAAWLNITLHTEVATRGAPRAYVRYYDLLADWERELGRVASELGVPWLADLDRSRHSDVDSLVDPSLRRAESGWDEIGPPASLRSLLDDVWALVSRLADRDADGAKLRAELDKARGDYVALYSEAEAIAQSSVTAAKPRRTRKAPSVESPGSTDRSPAPSPTLRLVRLIPARHRRRVPLRLRRAALRAGQPFRRSSF